MNFGSKLLAIFGASLAPFSKTLNSKELNAADLACERSIAPNHESLEEVFNTILAKQVARHRPCLTDSGYDLEESSGDVTQVDFDPMSISELDDQSGDEIAVEFGPESDDYVMVPQNLCKDEE